MMTKTLKPIAAHRASSSIARQVAVYARVSSEEQTKGNYPSCASQVEELIAACQSRGWQVHRVIKDEGFSAGSLKRPGLSELRWLVESGEISAVVCTWYDRLTRSRDFYVLDKEFQQHGVQFVTLHDPTDTQTAAGRFMESMLVAAKTYEREQTSEKVRSKMRMRAEKGMWNGGPIPFGFVQVDSSRTIAPDPNLTPIIQEMFRLYNETQTDYKVRDWLQARQILTHGGEARWTVSSVRRILTNRRYIAQIEINRGNKDLEDIPESEAYRVAMAPYEPIVSVEVFELAQAIRKHKGEESPNRVGKPRSYSQTQCQRVFTLQGFMVCGHCGHAMTPWYIKHKAGQDKSGKKRKNDSYVFYYICAHQRKFWKASDHKNSILARKAEGWVLDRLRELSENEAVLDAAVEKAHEFTSTDLAPVQAQWEENQKVLRTNQEQSDELVNAIASGNVQGSLWKMLNEKAGVLEQERNRLLTEQRRLKEQLTPLDENFDASQIRGYLRDIMTLIRYAEAEELHRLLRLTVRRIEWRAEGNYKLQLYMLPKKSHRALKEDSILGQQSRQYPMSEQKQSGEQKTNCPPAQGAGGQWLYTDVCSDTA